MSPVAAVGSVTLPVVGRLSVNLTSLLIRTVETWLPSLKHATVREAARQD